MEFQPLSSQRKKIICLRIKFRVAGKLTVNQFPCVRNIASGKWNMAAMSESWLVYKSSHPSTKKIVAQLQHRNNLFDIFSWDKEPDRERLVHIYLTCCYSKNMKVLEKQDRWLDHPLENYVGKITAELFSVGLTADTIRLVLEFL